MTLTDCQLLSIVAQLGTFAAAAEREGATLYIPPLKLCGDNAAMVAAQGFYEYRAGNTAGLNLNGLATLGIDYL